MSLRMMTTSEVSDISKNHKTYVDQYLLGIGYFATSDPDCQNLGSIACHGPYTRGRFSSKWVSQDKNSWKKLPKPYNFITGYTPQNEIDSLLFDKEGTYKKLWALSDDLVLVKHGENVVGLKIPDEWCEQYDYHTLLYSFLVQTREQREFPQNTVKIKGFMDEGFTLHESYILSYMFGKDFSTIDGYLSYWGGVHQIFRDNLGIDLQKYTTGEVSLWFNGPRTSEFWTGPLKFGRFVYQPFYTGYKRKFGDPPGHSFPVDKDGLIGNLKKFMRK